VQLMAVTMRLALSLWVGGDADRPNEGEFAQFNEWSNVAQSQG
jgi:hypothetical protein